MQKIKNTLAITILLLLCFYLRTLGSNWDQNTHQHPDERFIEMVSAQLKIPTTLSGYLDPQQSSLSPFNNNFEFYVYGGFPLTLVKVTAVVLDNVFPQSFKYDSYDYYHVIGRFYQAVFDTGTALLVYMIAKKIYNKKIGMLALLIYSFTIIVIQQSNFYTMDIFALFFMTLTVKLLLDFIHAQTFLRQILSIFLVSLSTGFALSSKLSAFTVILSVFLFLLLSLIRKSKPFSWSRFTIIILQHIFLGLLFILITYLAFRLLQPFIFVDANFFNLAFNEKFLAAMTTQYKLGTGEIIYPYTIQWFTATKFLTPFINLSVWAIGLPIMLPALFTMGHSLYYTVYALVKKRFKLVLNLQFIIQLILICYTLVTFIYLGNNFIQYVRYFLPIVPFIAIFAAKALSRLVFSKKRYKLIIGTAFVIAFELWTIAFLTIYLRPNIRIESSIWAINNIPDGAKIGHEVWDDMIPFNVAGEPRRNYVINEVDMYRVDNSEKLTYLAKFIADTDYIVLASSRQSKSVGQLPNKFPISSKYYQKLSSGELGFELIYKGGSYPSLLGIDFNDEWAEESIYIYDHPTVWIFKKTNTMTVPDLERLLSQ